MQITVNVLDARMSRPLPPALAQESIYFTSGDLYDWITEARKALPPNALVILAAVRETTDAKPFTTWRGRLDEALGWVRGLPDWADYAWKEGRGG